MSSSFLLRGAGRVYFFLALCALQLLAACGGGGSAPLPGAVAASGAITLALTNAQGVASTTATSQAPLTLRATLTDKTQKAAAGVIVTFETNGALGAITPAIGTALTDASGVATVTVSPVNATVGGAGTVTARATVDGTPITATVNYAVQATQAAAGGKVELALRGPDGGSASTLTTARPLTAYATVLDLLGKPVANQMVSFGTDNTVATLSPAGTALTNAGGVASVTIKPASLSASG
ncbi:MAG TPA: hypothetical protein VIT92_02660, partial [Burkholderiaceae bacterium]